MTPQAQWLEKNTRYLMARWLAVRERLLPAQNAETEQIGVEDFEREALDIAATMGAPPTLDRVCQEFDLSSFERDVLLLCAGVELDPEFNEICSRDPQYLHLLQPTFHAALANLPDANWAAITPASPLRFWRLIEVDRRDQTLANSPLRLDERILHYLVGADYLDERLANFFQLVRPPKTMPPSYRQHAEQIMSLWINESEAGIEQPEIEQVRKRGLPPLDESEQRGQVPLPDLFNPPPIIRLTGDWQSGRSLLAAASCAALGLRLYSLNASDIPANSVERETLLRLWQRESLLLRSALLLAADDADAESLRTARNFARRVGGLVFISGDLTLRSEPVATVEINLPQESEQRTIWEESLGPLAARFNGQLDEVITQFRFDPERIRSVARAVREKSVEEEVEKALWRECRVESRALLKELAECIEPKARWDDLVLPSEHLQTLGEIAAQVRQRMKVYQSWGFAARNDRGLGITALFAGPSGTGKTLAAEVLANDLQLDLHRIDLSQVVSKYIGDTEKNLRAVFDAAEQTGAVLLFDEADALFGKRSEVRDSHDRYANIEVSYLLQRMEAYRGLAILTTNKRGSLDPAFLRRLRFVITFPFPDGPQRAKIWARIFPPETPVQDLDVLKLARLNVAGGNIRNIALNAAFLAADLGEPVQMSHLLRTARSECNKIEKQITAAEIGGWA